VVDKSIRMPALGSVLPFSWVVAKVYTHFITMASDSLVGVLLKFLLPLFPALFLVWYVVTSIQTWYPLRHIPGPFLAKFSYSWMLKIQSFGKQHFAFREVNLKYGKHADDAGMHQH
jgi:hypothetical protein